jgi:hypothetical protein
MIVKKINNNININILLSLIISIEYLSFLFLNEFYLRFIEAQLMIVFLYSIISIFTITKKWIDMYMIFLVLTFLFMLSRPYMHLFGLVDFVNYNEQQWYKASDNFTFSAFTMIKINFVLLYSLIALNIGYLVGYKKYYKISFMKSIKDGFVKIFNKKISYLFFIIGASAFLIKVILYIKLLNQYGYFYLYSGNYTLPFLIRVLDDFLYIGYVLILVGVPSKKEAYILSVIFILLYASMLLTGMRGEFFVSFFAMIWLLSTLYDWQIKLYKIILTGLGLILLAQSILMIKYSYISYEDVNFFDLINLFIFSQGVSVLILGYVIEFSDIFIDIYSGFRYLIAPFVSMFYTLTGQQVPRTLSDPDTIYDISSKLEFFLNPQAYYSGGGTGSSYIVEFFTLGGDVILLFIGTFFIGFFIAYLSKKLIYQKYGLFITMIILQMLFWLPRSSIAILGKRYIFAIILIIFFTFIYKLLKKKEVKEL